MCYGRLCFLDDPAARRPQLPLIDESLSDPKQTRVAGRGHRAECEDERTLAWYKLREAKPLPTPHG
nr:unnamed protein product [Digitaria exilis]